MLHICIEAVDFKNVQRIEREKNYRSSFWRPYAESDEAITDAGNVSGIVIKDGHVSFTVEIDPKEKDKADDLRRACEKAVLGLDKVLSATALLTAHQAGRV